MVTRKWIEHNFISLYFRFVHVDERWCHTSYRGCLSFLRFFKMGDYNLSTLSMNTYFWKTEWKYANNRKKQCWFVSWEYTIYILLILRKAWLQGLANDWKNICSQISGYVWTRRQNYPGCITGLVVPCQPLTFLDAKKQTVFGWGLLSRPNPRPKVDFFFSDESRVGRSESAVGSPSLSQGLKSPWAAQLQLQGYQKHYLNRGAFYTRTSAYMSYIVP